MSCTQQFKFKFEEYLYTLWLNSNGKSTSTFKLNNNDVWLALSHDGEKFVPLAEWDDNLPLYLYLVPYANGVLYQPETVRASIETLVAQLDSSEYCDFMAWQAGLQVSRFKTLVRDKWDF